MTRRLAAEPRADKMAGMSTAALLPSKGWYVRALVRPLPLPQFLAFSAALVFVGALYCQLYCAIAFHPMRGAYMPLTYSFAWAIGAVMPWLLCFELCKPARLPARPAFARRLTIAAWFAGAAMLSIVLELGIDQLIAGHSTRPMAMQIAAQMPAAAITALFLIAPRDPAQEGAVEGRAIPSEPLAEVLAIGSAIDWIEAAGNYVQVHAGGRTTLHRVTMREVEAALDPTAFVRIHRSAIVHISSIEGRVLIGGSAAVRLRDGALIKIGSRYAHKFDAMAV